MEARVLVSMATLSVRVEYFKGWCCWHFSSGSETIRRMVFIRGVIFLCG